MLLKEVEVNFEKNNLKNFQFFFFFLEENDYTLAFYIFDAFLLVTILISFKLKVTLKTEVISKRREILKLFNLPAIVFFAILFFGGILWGVHDTYLLIYLQDELGASSQLLSKKLKSFDLSLTKILFL